MRYKDQALEMTVAHSAGERAGNEKGRPREEEAHNGETIGYRVR